VSELPDLASLSRLDERLRETASDAGAVARALDVAEAALAAEPEPAERARLESYRGNALRLLGRHTAAVAAQRRALELAEAAGAGRRALVARVRLGEALRCADDPPAAAAELRAAAALARRAQPELLDFALQHLGKALADAGESAEAVAVLEEALALRQAKGEPELVRSTLLALERARERQ
jgi:tetratricopeptide (TPR) repeat protein